MIDNAAIALHLAGFREGLLADGYDLTVDGYAEGIAHLRITAGPAACADCLVPKTLMASMLKESLRGLPDIRAVELAYPQA